MTRQYVQRSNQSHRQAPDSGILQRTAVRSIPVTTVQTEPIADDKPRLKQDWTQIAVRNRYGPKGDRMAPREEPNIGETPARSPLSPAQLSYSAPVQPIQAKLTINEKKSEADSETPVQPMAVDKTAENKTGLPDRLKEGIESLSGFDLSAVGVNYNSPKPAKINALAYTQGQRIEIGPGKEGHLPHEAWHVVQQMQGRVRPTVEVKGYGVNDDGLLEHEADVMGDRAMQMGSNRRGQQMPESGSRSKNGTVSAPSPVQLKLTIGQPNDKYEQEADRIGAEVVARLNGPCSEASPENQTGDRPEAAPPFQTKTAPSAPPPIQTQEGGGISPELEASIQQAKGSGSPMPLPLRSKMERAFGGTDLGGVKIHTGIESDRLNRSIQARAFTSGRDIFFRQGEYRPESKESQQLIAHELVHVQQQNPDRIQRSPEEEELNRNRLRTTAMDMYMKGYMQQRNRGQGSGQNHRSSEEQAIASGGINIREINESTSKTKDLLEQLKGAISGENVQFILEKGGLEWDSKVAGKAIGKRLPKGPLSDREFLAMNILSRSQEGNRWLEAAGMYNRNQAKQYLTAHDYHDWLKLEPANRVLLTHFAWRLPNVVALKDEQVEGTPPYRLGRSMDAKDKNIDPKRRKEYEEAIDRDLQQEWIKTLKGKELNEDARKAIEDGKVRKEGKKKGSPLSLSEVEQQHHRATEILEAVLILLQGGLEVYEKWLGEHADYEGSVIRALSHGGRVNVRIPALKNKKENPYALTDWLGITENKKVEESGAVFSRPFGTHHMAIGKNIDRQPGTGTFREEGGSKAAIKNKFDNTKLYGMNLAVGGIGERDFNGEVILPDGAHGHMFIGFKPPTIDRDGALQIGIETTAPGGASTVGYHHGPKSSEATANPESSFGGLKADKVGYGNPAKAAFFKGEKLDDATTNARMVDLNKIEYDNWLEYLSYVKHLFDIVKKENIEEYYSLLVGNRSQASLEKAILRLTGERLV
ncbi:MAG: DUF4157 domain-containing protein [Hormoscilla sp. GUM202]|nr:DUF4157 domain-containing protein [Hormoscilla sp. GUM202]